MVGVVDGVGGGEVGEEVGEGVVGEAEVDVAEGAEEDVEEA